METRFDNIVHYLDRKGITTWVQTYQPITSAGVLGKAYERRGRNVEIWRTRWIGGDLFHRLLKYPVLDALYLCPLLFLKCFWFLFKNHSRVKVIHAAGFNAALIARLLYYVFRIPYVVTIHALYSLEPQSKTSLSAKWILKRARKILALSHTSRRDILNCGVSAQIVGIHTNWIDVDHFRPLNKEISKKALGLEGKFVVVMVGRLKRIKGVSIVIELARRLEKHGIVMLVAGDGDMREEVLTAAQEMANLVYVGRVRNTELPEIYSAGDVSLVPSVYPEGFARVVLESLGCGLPVVASNVGCIPEQVDEGCGILVEPKVGNFEEAILTLYNAPDRLKKMSAYARRFCCRRYSAKNMHSILEAYGFIPEGSKPGSTQGGLRLEALLD
ncbi:MAG: glycosyltransferase family 4 protein [Deltaproteobacteria bacterium]|nr:glycosyltransferase family 4 protein [Deltaproteobacteria bacterium]